MRVCVYRKLSIDIAKSILAMHVLVASACAQNKMPHTTYPVPAPGRGELAEITPHYKTQPSFYDFNNIPAKELFPGVTQRFIMGTQTMVTRWDLAAGIVLPVHFHPQEQISRVEKGTIIAYSQGQKYVLTPGKYMIFPPNVPHQFEALEDSSLVEVFTPVRQDFLSGGSGGIPLPPKSLPPKKVDPNTLEK